MMPGVTGFYSGWYDAEWWRSQAPYAQRCTNVLVTPPSEEPLTLDQAKLRAGLDWAVGDPRDDLMMATITAARQRVEADTGRALINQARRVTYDVIGSPVIQLPALARPVLELVSVTNTDYYGAVTTIDPALYQVDMEAGRIYFKPGSPIYFAVRPFQGWQIDLTAGRADAAELAALDPALMQAVGMLTAHLSTMGRDMVIEDRRVTATPHGYDDLLAAYQPITVA
jgi:uncharacterized phiE125 gp8 family phage protein